MTAIELLRGERRLGVWTLNTLPPAGGRCTGPLLVRDRRLLFQARFDSSPGGMRKELGHFRDTRACDRGLLGVDALAQFIDRRSA